MQAAGALWSLSIDGTNLTNLTNLGADGRSSSPSGTVIKTNQELIADAGGIIKLIELLRSSTKFGSSASAQVAQETIAGALHSLTARPRNRELIAQADGITHMVPLLFGSASDLTKSEAAEAMHALAAGNKENVLSLVTQTTSWLAKTPLAAQEAAGTMALQVIHHTLSCCPLMATEYRLSAS